MHGGKQNSNLLECRRAYCLHHANPELQYDPVIRTTHTWNGFKSVTSAHNGWGHISPNQLAVWAHWWLMQAVLAPHPTLTLCSLPQAAWLSVQAGFHWGKPRGISPNKLASQSVTWFEQRDTAAQTETESRGSYLSSGGERNVSRSADCTKAEATDYSESQFALRLLLFH